MSSGNVESISDAGQRTRNLAAAWCLGCLMILAWSVHRNLSADRPEIANESADRDEAAPAVRSQPPGSDPLAGLPVIAEPVSPLVAPLADRSLPDHVRIRPLIDGSIPAISSAADLALTRRILRDPREGDTLRNEVANLLTRSGSQELASDLLAVLAHPAEAERFRSFAMQHLGVLWEQAGRPAAGAMHAALISGLDEPQIMVRREALLALACGRDAQALTRVRVVLADPTAMALHDLGCRIVGELGLEDCLPAVRAHLAATDPLLRAAAVEAVAALRDETSRAAVVAATTAPQTALAATARRVLAAWPESQER